MSTAARDVPPVPRGGGREAITAAALSSFAERGFHGTSIRDIARRAGLSLSAMYYWHPSKQHLLAALIEESMHDYLDRCAAALAAAGTNSVERLRALVRTTVEYRVERRVASNVGIVEWRNLDPDKRAELAGVRRSASRMWADLFREGVATGAFGCPEPDDARRAVVAACNAIAQWYEPGGPIGTEQLVERYTDIAFRVADVRR